MPHCSDLFRFRLALVDANRLACVLEARVCACAFPLGDQAPVSRTNA